MATGLTCRIKDGISFKEFALICSRQFGALFGMRDGPTDADIPDVIKPSDYHKDAIEKVQQELKDLSAMSTEEIDKAWKAGRKKIRADNKRRVQEANTLLMQYNEMLIQVEDWKPPTWEHRGLKKLMIEQIQDSIKCDCDPYQQEIDEEQLPEDWYVECLNEVHKSIVYHKKQWAEDKERASGKTAWIQALKKSLGMKLTNKA